VSPTNAASSRRHGDTETPANNDGYLSLTGETETPANHDGYLSVTGDTETPANRDGYLSLTGDTETPADHNGYLSLTGDAALEGGSARITRPPPPPYPRARRHPAVQRTDSDPDGYLSLTDERTCHPPPPRAAIVGDDAVVWPSDEGDDPVYVHPTRTTTTYGARTDGASSIPFRREKIYSEQTELALSGACRKHQRVSKGFAVWHKQV
jgi:hypothetical protein